MHDADKKLRELERKLHSQYEIHLNEPNPCRWQDEYNKDDAIWGHSILPEYSVWLELPPYKKPSLKATIKYKWIRTKQRLAKLVLWIANNIGRQNV